MIYVSAGHFAEHPGASYGSFNEHDEAKIWASILLNKLGHNGMMVPVGNLSNKVDFIKKMSYGPNTKKDIAIDIHFNSAKNSEGEHVGRGSETLYFPGSVRGAKVATVIQSVLGTFFLPDRGIKEGYYQMNKAKGPDFFLSHTPCTAIIIEPEFIHRRAKIVERREVVCESLATALLTFLAQE